MEEPALKALTPTPVFVQLVSLVPTVSSKQHLAHQTPVSMVSVTTLEHLTHVPATQDLWEQTAMSQIHAPQVLVSTACARLLELHLSAIVMLVGLELSVTKIFLNVSQLHV